MCQIGEVVRKITVPQEQAITARKILVREVDGKTRSLVKYLGTDDDWIPGTINVADCIMNDHVSPNPFCSCGFWAFKNQMNLARFELDQIGLLQIARLRGNIHEATVKVWGRVIEHEFGYRSEYIELVSIDDQVDIDSN